MTNNAIASTQKIGEGDAFLFDISGWVKDFTNSESTNIKKVDPKLVKSLTQPEISKYWRNRKHRKQQENSRQNNRKTSKIMTLRSNSILNPVYTFSCVVASLSIT